MYLWEKQTKKPGPLSHTTHKNQLRIDHRPKTNKQKNPKKH